MGEQLSVADVLDRAADLLSKPGAWNGCDNLGRHCIALAIDHVSGGTGNPEGQRARLQFARFMGFTGDRPETFGIYAWNDDPQRTHNEVVAKLREAAALARESVA